MAMDNNHKQFSVEQSANIDSANRKKHETAAVYAYVTEMQKAMNVLGAINTQQIAHQESPSARVSVYASHKSFDGQPVFVSNVSAGDDSQMAKQLQQELDDLCAKSSNNLSRYTSGYINSMQGIAAAVRKIVANYFQSQGESSLNQDEEELVNEQIAQGQDDFRRAMQIILPQPILAPELAKENIVEPVNLEQQNKARELFASLVPESNTKVAGLQKAQSYSPANNVHKIKSLQEQCYRFYPQPELQRGRNGRVQSSIFESEQRSGVFMDVRQLTFVCQMNLAVAYCSKTMSTAYHFEASSQSIFSRYSITPQMQQCCRVQDEFMRQNPFGARLSAPGLQQQSAFNQMTNFIDALVLLQGNQPQFTMRHNR